MIAVATVPILPGCARENEAEMKVLEALILEIAQETRMIAIHVQVGSPPNINSNSEPLKDQMLWHLDFLQ